MTTGLRRGELLGLEWSDVDLDACRLHVRRAWVMVGGRPREAPTKNEQSRRGVDLDAATVAALRAHRTAQKSERLAWGPAWVESGRLFTREEGTPIRPDWFTRRFQRLAADAGLRPIPLHGLRHSHATALLRAGIHPRVVQERLGHRDIGVTLQVYSSVLETMGQEAADRLATILDA